MARAIDTAATCRQDALILAPPRCGKSTIFAHLLPLWLTEVRKIDRVIVVCENSSFADHWRKRFAETSSEGAQRCAKFIGTGAAIAGCGADVFVLDPWTYPQDLEGPSLQDWYNSTVRSRLMPGGFVVTVTNRRSDGDFASYLMRQGIATTHVMREALPLVYDDSMNARISKHPEVLHYFYNQSLGEKISPVGTYSPPTSKHKCGGLTPNLQAEWFNAVPPEMVERRTPVLWRCSRGHVWIDTKESRQRVKGFDKCLDCQYIDCVSRPNLSNL